MTAMQSRPALENLLSVVAGGETQTHSDTTITLISLEVYADGVMTNFSVRYWDEHLQQMLGIRRKEHGILWPHFYIMASDGMGNIHTGESGGGSSGPSSLGERERWRTSGILTPTFAQDAHKIRLEIPELQLVEFATVSAPPFFTVQRTFPGPWVFDIALRRESIAEKQEG